MSDAKVCDRCGAVEKGNPNLVDMKITFSRINEPLPQKAHLCEECKDGFRSWFSDGQSGGDSA